MDPDTGIFTTPLGGTYLFVLHIATHDNKKALLSIRVNGEEIASVFDQVKFRRQINSRVNQLNLEVILNAIFFMPCYVSCQKKH